MNLHAFCVLNAYVSRHSRWNWFVTSKYSIPRPDIRLFKQFEIRCTDRIDEYHEGRYLSISPLFKKSSRNRTICLRHTRRNIKFMLNVLCCSRVWWIKWLQFWAWNSNFERSTIWLIQWTDITNSSSNTYVGETNSYTSFRNPIM